jgi:hypothetical protein
MHLYIIIFYTIFNNLNNKKYLKIENLDILTLFSIA